MEIEKTKYYSYKIGELAKGCQLCVQGKKLVLLVTGLCGRGCYYCPLSDKKKNKDVVYANEWPTDNIKDIIKEAELCSSRGAGITGGDPLAVIERTVVFIKALKERFGKTFHIHLYTPLIKVNEENLKKLRAAGLDEIRFHPDLDDNRYWNKLKYAKSLGWDIGIEIPAIPGKKSEILQLIDYAKEKIDFLNINELEISDTNASKLGEYGFETKGELSYGIKGSEELAMEIMEYCKKIDLKTHYCTTILKDKVQLMNRIKRRAKNVKEKFDKITSEGTLIRGVVYLKGLEPGFGYTKKIQSIKNKEEVTNALEEALNKIKSKYHINHEKTKKT